MRLDFYIAHRLKLNDNDGNRVKMSVRISTAGVVLSVVIMMITIAVTSGFKHEIISKLTGFDAQLTVQAAAMDVTEQQPVMVDAEAVKGIIGEVLPGAVVEESIKMSAMLKTEDNFSAVVFRGYGGEGHNDFIKSNLIEGEIPASFSAAENSGNTADGVEDNSVASSNDIIISSTVAGQLGLSVGDKINTCFFAEGKMRLRNFRVAAIYDSGFGEYDKAVAYAPLSTLRKLSGLPDGIVSGLEISRLDLKQLAVAQDALQNALVQEYYSQNLTQYLAVDSILHTGAVYFNWLSLLDTNVIVIVILMSAISAFTLIASLIILILERVNMIGTLKMLGATNSLIRRIFILLDLKVLIKGLVAGNIIALAVILLQQHFHILPLDAEAYYISFVPVKITLLQVVVLNAAALAVATAVMIIPSMIISGLKPAAILRYE